MLNLESTEAADAAPPRAAASTRGRGLALAQIALLAVALIAWYGLTTIGVLPPFFFGEPAKVAAQLWVWFASGKIYLHLGVTLLETVLAFGIGTALGLAIG